MHGIEKTLFPRPVDPVQTSRQNTKMVKREKKKSRDKQVVEQAQGDRMKSFPNYETRYNETSVHITPSSRPRSHVSEIEEQTKPVHEQGNRKS